MWSKLTVDNAKDYTITGAPRVFDGKVLIGNGGGERNVRGYVTAYDAESGEQLWRWFTVPGNPANGFENAAMERAAANIRAVHAASLPQTVETSPEPGIVVGRRPDPLTRVGVYAPGGRAAYPSSVLMGVIPARVAGVGDRLSPNWTADWRGAGQPNGPALQACTGWRRERAFARRRLVS